MFLKIVTLVHIVVCEQVGMSDIIHDNGNNQKERGQERKLTNYSTKVYEGVPIIVKDVEYTEPDNVRGNYEWPVTLPPKLLKDGFQIQPTKTGDLAPITKTEFSTFTYLVTSVREDGNTLVETDIVVSSNIVTSTPGAVEATPVLEQISSTSFEPPSGYMLMQTKTYFTTSTFYTTYIDKDRTITKTRTNVRSSVLTETYTGGQFDYLPGPDQTLSPTIEESPKVKYLSLGPNIYGKVKTLYTTFTYFNGVGVDSQEVITQESTSVFSTTSLPASITIAPSPPLPSITPSASLQLDRDTLLSLKNQYISQLSSSSSASDSVEPSFTATYAPDEGSVTVSSSSATPVIPDTSQLSSIKESYQSQFSSSTSTASSVVETDVNLPSTGNTIIRPSTTSTTKASSSSSVLTTTAPSGSVTSSDDDNDSESDTSSTATQDAIAGGLLGAVVGGISSALLPPQPPPSGIQVDLGPVLDAVATLLRGPIRSAIANRRNTAQNTDRTDIEPSRTATLPQFARLPSTEPNVIPVGGYSSSVPSRDPQYGFIPLNAPQLQQNQQALPRSDTELESEGNYNDISQLPEDLLNILENSNNGGDNPIVIDNDKIVINDHIIRTTDPHIIDVLNKYEHSYLYNKETNDPLKIRIAAGEPMSRPQTSSKQQPTKIFGITLPKLNIGGVSKPKKKPLPPPQRPPQNNNPPPRRPKPPPPRRPPPPPNAKRPYNVNNINALNKPPPPQIKNVPVKYKPPGTAPSRPSVSYNTNTANIRPQVNYNQPPGPSNTGYNKQPNNGVGNYNPPKGSSNNVVQPPRGSSGNYNAANGASNNFVKPPRGSSGNYNSPNGASDNLVQPPRGSSGGYNNVDPSSNNVVPPQIGSSGGYNGVPNNYGQPPRGSSGSFNTPSGSPKQPPRGSSGSSYKSPEATNLGYSNKPNGGVYNPSSVTKPLRGQSGSFNSQNGGGFNSPDVSSNTITQPFRGSSGGYNPSNVGSNAISNGGYKPPSGSSNGVYSNQQIQTNVGTPPRGSVTNQISTSNSYNQPPSGNTNSLSNPQATYTNQNLYSPNTNPLTSSNKYPPQSNVIDPSVNHIPGSNQWNTYGPGSGQTNGYKDSGNFGQGQKNPVDINQHQSSHSQHGISSTLSNDGSNLEDSLSSVSEQSKVVMAAPAGMIEDDNEGQDSDKPTAFDPTVSHHAQHISGNTANSFQGTSAPSLNGQVNSNFGTKFPNKPNVPSRTPSQSLRPVPAVPRPAGPSSPPRRTTARPLPIRRTTSRPLPTRRSTVRPPPTRRSTVRPIPTRRSTTRPLQTFKTTLRPLQARPSIGGISRKPSINGTPSPFRPNQVAIDVPAFGPNDNSVRDPFGQVFSQQQGPTNGNVHRNQHNNNGGNPRQPTNSNPYKSRQTASELSASVIQGSNQIIGNGGGIVIGVPTKGFMRDVTITGTDGSTAVIQTRFDGVAAPELDPSFTVSAGYSPQSNTGVYNIDITKESPLFTLIKPSSNKNYEYEGWLTDGDPLKDLPPLRPTATQPLNIKVVETEAPKTVTYQNEWQTPTNTPTADFVPFSPPPPASNFEREWSTYKSGQVETVNLIRPTNTLGLKVKETEAPKTVTYQNEWFANSATKTATPGIVEDKTPDVVPDFVRKNPYSSISPAPLRTPRPSRPKYVPKVSRPRPSLVGTVEEASVNDDDESPTSRPFRNRPTRLPPTRRVTPSPPFRRVTPTPPIRRVSITPTSPRRRPSPTPPRRRLTPTPEIITGGVRVPPRPPQRYDPYAENEDQFPDVVNDNDDYSETFDTTRHHSNHGGIRKKPVRPGRPNNDGANNYEVLLQNAVKNGGSDEVDTDNDNPNIKVSSDGYNGYKEINTGYPDKDQDSDAYNDQLIKDGGSGLNEFPPSVTTIRPLPPRPTNNGIGVNTGDYEKSSNRTYHSSEFVNEKRYNIRRKPASRDDVQDDNNGIFAPTRKPLRDDESDGRQSSGVGEIDLHNFFGGGEEKANKKRKFETSTSTRKTFITSGKPTFINIDLSTAVAVPGKDTTDDKKDVIITTPIKIIDEQTTSRIRPISTISLSRSISTLSGTISASPSPIVSSIRLGGLFPKRPRPDLKDLFNNKPEEEIKDDEVLNKNVEAAIVEQVPEHILSAEDQDPQTKCQKSCGSHEMCHITQAGRTECKCRPGFGKPTNLPGSKCEKSMMYQIEVFTTSESEETRIVRFNPNTLQQALDQSFENKIKDLYHHSEITSIKVNNNTKRNFELNNKNNEDVNRDSKEDMKIKLLVQVADENVAGLEEEERIRSLIEPTLKETNLPLGSDVMVSRVTIDDFDECSSAEYNDCSNKAQCTNTKGSYNCTCMPGYLDITPATQLPGRLCSGASTECELCNRNGQCVLDSTEVTCNCNPWYAGKNCQINLKLLLIVGAVSVCLMMIIACGVSCFCCRDRRKKPIPVPYGVSMARLPPNVRQHSMMMDPSGTVKSAMSGRSRQQAKRHAVPPPSHHGHPPLGARNSGPWQDGFGSGSVTSRSTHVSPSRVSHVSGAGSRSHSRGSKPALVIPRAKVTPSRGYTNNGYHSDDDRFSSPVEKNRAMSEVESQGSRHRRRSVPSFASSLLGGRGRREGSVDPLLEGFQSDGGDSGGRNSNSTFHRSVSRGDLDAMDRAETRSVARSFNETIIRPVTRRLQSAAGTSTRSNRSTRTSEDGRTMAEKDGGSSFVVSPRQQLYRLHDSDGSFESL